MHSLLLFVPILMWSFVGLLVKASTLVYSPALVSFGRFFFGVIALGIWFLVIRKKPRFAFFKLWIWIGALGKTANYVLENVAIQIGYSWGNILVQPIQSIVLLFMSAFYFKEAIGKRKLSAVALCIAGVLLVSWNGNSWEALATGGFLVPLLFAVSAVGAAVHLMSQKVLIDTMDSGDLNLSTFILASFMTLLPLPFEGPLVLDQAPWLSHVSANLALLALGAVTGISFLIWGALMRKVPFLVSGIMANATALFTLLWSRLLTQDPIGPWVIGGTVVFLTGLLLLNLPGSRPKPHQ